MISTLRPFFLDMHPFMEMMNAHCQSLINGLNQFFCASMFSVIKGTSLSEGHSITARSYKEPETQLLGLNGHSR